MSHEGWGEGSAGDLAARVESFDPCLGEIGVEGFFLRAHGHEEFAKLLITAGTHQKVLSEAVV